MSRSSLRVRLFAAGVSAAAMTASLPALAETPIETTIRNWVSALDASPNWVAGFSELSYDESQRTVTLRNLTIRSETLATKMEVSFGTIGITNYAEAADGGFRATGITVDSSKMTFGDLGSATLADIRVENLAVPSFVNFVFDQNRIFTSLAKGWGIVAKASVDSIRIGRIDATETTEGQTSAASFGSYELKGMANGVIDQVTLGPVSQEMPSPDGLLKFTIDKIEARKYDLDAVSAVLDPDRYVGGVGDGKWRTVLGLEVYRNFSIEMPGASIRMGSFEMENLRMRQPKTSFADLFDTILSKPELTDEDTERLLSGNIAGLFSFVGVGAVRLNDLDITAPEIERFHLGDFHINDFSSDGIGEIGISDLDVAVQDKGSVGAERLAIGGFKFPSTEVIMSSALAATVGMDFDPMAIIPTMGFAEAVGVDVTQAGKKLGAVDRARIDLGDYVGPVPTTITSEMRGLDLDLSQIDDRRARDIIKGLGYDRLVADYGFRLAWREADDSLILDGFKLAIKDLATMNVDATLTGLTRQAIEDPKQLEGALASLLFTRGKLAIEDKSIVDRAIGMQATKMKVEPDKFRQQIAGALPLFLMVLKNPGFQAKLAPALQAFIKTPGTMTIAAEPTTPVPVTTLMETAESAPQKLPDLLQVEIKTTP
ncbi:hypothetical protein [Kaistia terrae]|uniref:AsmA-like C-terminal domain-containing protein n=1 Tax=Kaistia terrae TaxID=537017 RepID=A0ABW0PUU8_9HYPH|nr:hypothetical protein [Kaistia terrae]MCX5577055.1 hypothetical protein [Kaistia terrae]